MTTIDELIEEKTRDEIMEDVIVVAQDEGLATTTWQSGSIVRTILVVFSQIYANFSTIIIEPIRGGFGDLLSSIGWAKLWAKQTYDVDAVEAEPATGYVTAINASEQEFVQPAGDIILAHSVTGKLYRNVEDITIPALTTVEDIAIASVETGTGNNAAPEYVTVLVGPTMDGVTFSNPDAVLGANAETVEALVTRSREKMAALSPLGPKEAYNYIVKTPEFCATGTPITRASTYADPLTGAVTVYCATATGAPVDDDVEICQAAIEEWAEPWCTGSTAVAATEVEIDITYEVWVKSSIPEAEIESAIDTALSTFFEDTQIGGTIIPPATGKIYRDSITVVIGGATLDGEPDGTTLGVRRALVTLPDADEDTDADSVLDAVNLDEGEVAILGTVTGTVHFL